MKEEELQTKLTNGYSYTPNIIYDELQPNLSTSAFSVFLVVFRLTYGFGRYWEYIPMRVFHQRTGLTKPTIKTALNDLLISHLIIRELVMVTGGYPDSAYALGHIMQDELKNFILTSTKNLPSQKHEFLMREYKKFEVVSTKNLQSYLYNINSLSKIKKETSTKNLPSEKIPFKGKPLILDHNISRISANDRDYIHPIGREANQVYPKCYCIGSEDDAMIYNILTVHPVSKLFELLAGAKEQSISEPLEWIEKEVCHAD